MEKNRIKNKQTINKISNQSKEIYNPTKQNKKTSNTLDE